MLCDEALAMRLGRACPGWLLQVGDEGYVLTPPGGAEALIRTRAALEDWLRHQERWREPEEVDARPAGEQLVMELA